nr:MAG TPA: hypothetical protein [Caudoviricetes sp.]
MRQRRFELPTLRSVVPIFLFYSFRVDSLFLKKLGFMRVFGLLVFCKFYPFTYFLWTFLNRVHK